MSLNLIAFQMNEFQSSVDSIENKFDAIFNAVRETLHDLNNAKECLDQAAAIDKNENKNELDTFKTKISEAVYQECESMKESLKELIQSSNECKQFKQKEAEIRLKFNENPDQFDEKNLKNLLNFKYVPQEIDHPKYLELEEIIENAKNGIESNGEDLVMESAPSNQVIKCPITGKPIQDLVKNALCDHSYEREAIMAYLKSRPNRKCPFAGCKQQVVISRSR